MNAFAVIGVRPQYIKCAALKWELAEKGLSIDVIDVRQHFSPSVRGELLAELELEVAHTLGPESSPSAAARNAGRLTSLISLLEARRADRIVVFGDATPALLGALAGQWLGIPVLHIEAGERRDKREVEDLNSRVVDAVADQRMCVTERALTHLRNEGLGTGTRLSGDLAVRWFMHQAESVSPDKRFADSVLVTLHRPHQMSGISTICQAFASRGQAVSWITHPRYMPEHLSVLREFSNVTVFPPLGFKSMIGAILGSRSVVSDSGGVLREAHQLGRYILALREVPVWPEITGDPSLGMCLSITPSNMADAARAAASPPPVPRDSSPLQRLENQASAMSALSRWLTCE